jgi:hypothetical protein
MARQRKPCGWRTPDSRLLSRDQCGAVNRFTPFPSKSNDNGAYPYTLAVLPCENPAGHFQRAIRKHGKRVERLERIDPSEQSARDQGQAALERQFRVDR